LESIPSNSTGQSKKFEDAEEGKALLDENSTRTLEELAEALNVNRFAFTRNGKD